MATITRDIKNLHISKVLALIETTNGRIFSACFTKKDGTLRTMVCRRGVSKGVKGTGKSVDITKPVLTVYEMCKGDSKETGFKMISLDTLHWIKINGIKYLITK